MDQNSNANLKKFYIILGVLAVLLLLIFFLRNNKKEVENQYDLNPASVSEVSVVLRETFPVEVDVIVKGDLPDGCTEISPDVKQSLVANTFNVELNTRKLKDSEVVCTQALVPFEETVSLENVLGISAGNYVVNVNGVLANFKMDVDNYISDVDPIK